MLCGYIWALPSFLLHRPCGQIIDKFGDHSALCDVLYQNLLVDNGGAHREQCCSSESSDRPGDVFRPHFLQGKAAYFDMSVRNSFSSQFVTSCAAEAGAAAVAGEIQKVPHYDLDVTVAGGVFYPILVETFGTWTPYSLEIIKIIARKTSLLNKLTVSKAVCNIHEQFSVCLWQYNARMILDRLHLVCPDDC